jgi:hypothetical protein
MAQQFTSLLAGFNVVCSPDELLPISLDTDLSDRRQTW